LNKYLIFKENIFSMHIYEKERRAFRLWQGMGRTRGNSCAANLRTLFLGAVTK
jgi:hypothetical protein